jgi:uncharacterized membrane protein
MTEFFTAIGIFLLAHIIPPTPAVRQFLIRVVGRRVYIVAYSLLSLVLIVWVIISALRAPYVALWPAEAWQVFVPLIVMPFAIWFVIGGLAESNPLSISLYSNTCNGLGPMAHITRHPVLWGFLLWALSHIPPNGNLVAVVLFTGMALLASGGFWLADRRARRRIGDKKWKELTRSTSIIPFAALARSRSSISGVSHLFLWGTIAIAVYIWFLLQGHALLIGLDPLASLNL